MSLLSRLGATALFVTGRRCHGAVGLTCTELRSQLRYRDEEIVATHPEYVDVIRYLYKVVPPNDSVQLVHIPPISLWFLLVIYL